MSYIVKKIRKYKVKKTGTPLVHCMAGVGRTGTMMACYIITEMLDKLKSDLKEGLARHEPDPFYSQYKWTDSNNKGQIIELSTADDDSLKNSVRFSLFALVRRLREQRWDMVNNVKQYSYLYKFLLQWIENEMMT